MGRLRVLPFRMVSGSMPRLLGLFGIILGWIARPGRRICSSVSHSPQSCLIRRTCGIRAAGIVFSAFILVFFVKSLLLHTGCPLQRIPGSMRMIRSRTRGFRGGFVERTWLFVSAAIFVFGRALLPFRRRRLLFSLLVVVGSPRALFGLGGACVETLPLPGRRRMSLWGGHAVMLGLPPRCCGDPRALSTTMRGGVSIAALVVRLVVLVVRVVERDVTECALQTGIVATWGSRVDGRGSGVLVLVGPLRSTS